MKTIAIMATAALFIAGCQATETVQTVDPVAQERALIADGWQPMDRDAIMLAHSDATHSGASEKYGPWSVYFLADGSMRGRSGKSGEYSDVGTYRVSEDGLYCRTWSKWLKGQEGCARHYQRGNELASIPVSGNSGEGKPWTFEKGNPLSL